MPIGDDFPSVLALARAGDRDALADIYRDTAPLIIGYLRANRVADAEDVAGDVFVSMIATISSFSGDERQFRSWLLTITHRRVVDNIRRRTRRPEDPAPESDLVDMADRAVTPTGEHIALERVRAQRIVDAIDDLSELQRSAIMLRALADLTVPETARVMGKPESAVKALLRRGSANLARSLADDAGTGHPLPKASADG